MVDSPPLPPIERIRSSTLLRRVAGCAGAAVGAAAALLLSAGLAAIPIAGTVVAGVAGTVAVGLAGAAAGALGSRLWPHGGTPGSSGLRRLAITAAVAGGAALLATGAGFLVAPAIAGTAAAVAAAGEGVVLGDWACAVLWDRFADAPVGAGIGR